MDRKFSDSTNDGLFSPDKKPSVSATMDSEQTLRRWLAPALGSSPFDSVTAQIDLKPGKRYFDLNFTAKGEADKASVLKIGEWADTTRAKDLMAADYERPVFGDASHIAASRTHFELGQPALDVIKGTATVRFYFKGPESKRMFIELLAEQQAARDSGTKKQFARGA